MSNLNVEELEEKRDRHRKVLKAVASFLFSYGGLLIYLTITQQWSMTKILTFGAGLWGGMAIAIYILRQIRTINRELLDRAGQ